MNYNGYEIAFDPTSSLKKIKPIGKGSVPKSLRGLFTSTTFAQRAIDQAIKETVEDTDNVKVKRSGRGKQV